MGSISIIVVIVYIVFIFVKASKRNENKQQRNGSPSSSATYQRPVQSNTTQYKQTQIPKTILNPTMDLTPAAPMQESVSNVPRAAAPQKTGSVGSRKIITDHQNKQLVLATRLMEGDRVPNGYRMQVCGYCGAENIVPMYYKENYGCYFCHEKI